MEQDNELSYAVITFLTGVVVRSDVKAGMTVNQVFYKFRSLLHKQQCPLHF